MDSGDGERDWSEIPHHLLDTVLNKYLVSIYDFFKFSLVCKSWHSVALHNKSPHRFKISSQVPQLPLLIVRKTGNNRNDAVTTKLALFDITKHMVVSDFHHEYTDPVWHCCGSSYGWLTMVNKTNKAIVTFNPFVTTLPPIHMSIGEGEAIVSIFKAILTKDPIVYPNDYALVAICITEDNGDILAIVKAGDGDTIWSTYSDIDRVDRRRRVKFSDVSVLNDIVYVLDCSFELWKVEICSNGSGRFRNLKRVASPPSPPPSPPQPPVARASQICLQVEDAFLVQCSNRKNFYSVRRIYRNLVAGYVALNYETWCFQVYKLRVSDLEEREENGTMAIQNLEEIKSLGEDEAMIISKSHSVCVSCKEFPNLLPNRIYFTCRNIDYDIYPVYECGIFNMEDERFDLLCKPKSALVKFSPTLTWITPSPNL